MDIKEFFKAVVSQKREVLKSFFHEDAIIKWYCTNEQFTVEEYIKVNCDYPGKWNGIIEKIEEKENSIIIACKVYSIDSNISFHVVSFIKLKNDKIIEMDEYWADDAEVPKWRKDMKIGKSIG